MDKKAQSVNKVVKWGQSYVVFLTKQVKALGWKEGDFVSVNTSDGEIKLKKVEV